MFRSTAIIRELAIEPGYSHIDIKTFSKVVIRWCGSMSGVVPLCTAYSTHVTLGHAAKPPNNNFTECFNINLT